MANTNLSDLSSKFQTLGRQTRRVMLWLSLIIVTLCVIYFFVAYHYTYSSGERAGYIQKISSKGWVCKTWEGQLAMVNYPGSMSEIFYFTVREDRIAAQISDLAGKRVVLDYVQHLGLPSCFGETEYFITAVHEIKLP
jgi:hypothetical protein